MLNLAVLVSGGGTNLQAVIDAVETGRIPDARIALVLSGKKGAFAMTRAERHGIRTVAVERNDFPDPEARARHMLDVLAEAETDLIILAGYLSILPPELIRAYENCILNVHPSLIPKYCGRGCYGKRVHEAVLAAGEKESGATVHLVDEGVDTGPILRQERVPVLAGDTAETLAARVLEVEHRILVDAVREMVEKLRQTEPASEPAAPGRTGGI